MPIERTLQRTSLYFDDPEVADAGHHDTWVSEEEHMAEATIALALGLTLKEVVQLRRECRRRKCRPSHIVGEALRDHLAARRDQEKVDRKPAEEPEEP